MNQAEARASAQIQSTCEHPAPNGPGEEPHWTRGDKVAVGTAYFAASNLWYTLSEGTLNEIYYATVDRPQIHTLHYLITDGKSFFQEEPELESQVEALSRYDLGVRVTSSDPAGRYRLIKEIIVEPHLPCLLMHTRLEAKEEAALRLFAFCIPHLEMSGWENNGQVIQVAGRSILIAYKCDTWLALGASQPFARAACGYVGVNDGRTELAKNHDLQELFDCAYDGHIALTGEIDLRQGQEFTLGLAFGNSCHAALTSLFQALGIPFAEQKQRFIEQWARASDHIPHLEQASGDGGGLYHRSHSLLLAHEDKLFPGAIVASLSIPWGEAKQDEAGAGGYHLVWTRDLVNSVTGLLAAGDTETPRRALTYLAVAQRPDGGFHQNFWVDGEPYQRGIQLDQVAFPILLAWRLYALEALKHFDPYPMVYRAAAYLIREGPATDQERWEESGGYSPSTLAVTIAALTCAASLLRERGDTASATFAQEYADFLEANIEAWTVTSAGTLVPDIPRHYIRLHPVDVKDPCPSEDPNQGTLRIANRGPTQRAEFPAKEIVDAGFLELVRYGIRKPGDPLIEDSLRVVDAVLKVETPYGPCWHRYNHDGYGQRPDGAPFEGWGKGRAWPLLTGERGHYELAAGRPVEPFIRAMERFAHGIGLLSEQVWDEADLPAKGLFCGRPTGAAMPLMWAHAEYIRLLRSAADGQVFDLLPEVVARYSKETMRRMLEVWKPTRQVQQVRPGYTLRIQRPSPFCLRWSQDEWQSVQESQAHTTALGIAFVDIPIAPAQRAPLCFTFREMEEGAREEREYEVRVVPAP